jgi:hypothetical protein
MYMVVAHQMKIWELFHHHKKLIDLIYQSALL